jgi:DNA-binding IclR family transcriptional regulator
MARRSDGETVLSKHLRVLDAFDAHHPSHSLTEIETSTGLAHATAHRIATELTAEGLLERHSDGTYRLGVRLWELASRTPGGLGLREAARPWMNAVHARVRQHTQLAVLNGLDALFIERMSTRDAVVNATLIGGRLPLPLSSSGIVLLAHGSEQLLEDVIRTDWPRHTRFTIPDGAALRAHVRRARRDGFAVLDGHIYEGSRGIAVPILGPHGEAYAALGLVVPNDDSPTQAAIELLAVAAAGIARALSDAYLPDGGATGRGDPRRLRPLVSTSKATLDYFAALGVDPSSTS